MISNAKVGLQTDYSWKRLIILLEVIEVQVQYHLLMHESHNLDCLVSRPAAAHTFSLNLACEWVLAS